MTITVGNVYAETPPGPVRHRTRELLAYRKKGYRFVKAYKQGHWDGYTRLVDRFGRFPAGLTAYCVDRLKAAGFDPDVAYTAARPEPVDPLTRLSLTATLDPHQERAVEAAYRAGRGVVHQPVGAGKSYILAGLIARCRVPALVLTHRKDLMYQNADVLRRTLDARGFVGTIGDGSFNPNWITVSTFQSLHYRLREFPDEAQALLARFQAVLVDECHHVSAQSYEQVLGRMTQAYYRFGVSATPHRQGDEETFFKVTGWLGPVVDRMLPVEALNTGRVVPADVFLVDLEGPEWEGTWPEQYARGIVTNRQRNETAVDLARRLPGPVLILIERIDHGRLILRMLRESGGGNYSFISGQDPGDERQAVLDNLRRGDIDVLVSSVILDEGIDLPNLRTLILAGGGKAPHKTVQRLGRGMRAADGKDRLVLVDFLDRGKYLGAHARSRRKTYESEDAYSVAQVTAGELASWSNGRNQP